jgi:hypothetical protein
MNFPFEPTSHYDANGKLPINEETIWMLPENIQPWKSGLFVGLKKLESCITSITRVVNCLINNFPLNGNTHHLKNNMGN